jgi:hypothetical protein
MCTVERSAVMGPVNIIQMMINESLLRAQKESLFYGRWKSRMEDFRPLVC